MGNLETAVPLSAFIEKYESWYTCKTGLEAYESLLVLWPKSNRKVATLSNLHMLYST